MATRLSTEDQRQDHHRRPRPILIALAVLLVIGLIVLTIMAFNGPNPVSRAFGNAPGSTACDQTALDQLSYSAVVEVQNTQKSAQIPHDQSIEQARRDLGGGYYSTFDTKFSKYYCGFISTKSINHDGNEPSPAPSADVANHDVVLYVHEDKSFTPSDGQLCVSNSLPMMQQTGDRFVAVVFCDRVYARPADISADVPRSLELIA